MRIAVIQGSARNGGNTEDLTRLVLEGIPYTNIVLREKEIKPIRDQRHEEGRFDPVDDDYDELIQLVLEHDVLIFATPVYWYGASGLMKNFIDRWSQSLRDVRFDFKERMASKTAYAVVVGGDNPRIKALPLIQQLQYTFDFVGLSFAGYVIGKGSKPGEVLKDARAVRDAATLNAELRKAEPLAVNRS
ncbi:flavodoxin family protein [Paenibacillus timonensis]|uniref:Flavodoxin family protein n=1 Tax=Paenibacillus timonensis TaxID=225915 RepID=A0ABW3SAM5_9BACL|nr:flavodoxin family protein [Paenibacillus timonensis]ECH9276406.1 flavodoxin family protein [Salmonella enterica subsp. enterica]MCH1640302.1 flavodoxin family protein [Paenibacillus timonensis]